MLGGARILDGKGFALALRGKIGAAAEALGREAGIRPGLAVVLVGSDPASSIYVRNKGAATEAAGMASFSHHLESDVAEAELLALIRRLNADPAVDGILVQLPLPPHIDPVRVIETIDPAKDVDGFHPLNIGRVTAGLPGGLVPCTPQGCLMLLRDALGDLAGRDAVVIGRSNIVGKPMAGLLLAEHCTVTLAHSRTRNLAECVARAEIVVAAVGRPELVTADWIRPGAAVIDVGINRIEGKDGKNRLVGDVDFESVRAVAGCLTPVPGGVGPMTIACLLRNTLIAACRRAGLPDPDL